MGRIYSLQGLLFLLHRITGGILLAYVVAHILTISTALFGGAALFDALMTMLAAPSFRVVEFVLLGCITFHALNGLRLILEDHGIGLDSSDRFAGGTVAATVAVWSVAGYLALVN